MLESAYSAEDVCISLHEALPDHLPVGRGQFLVISGECTVGRDEVEWIAVRAGEREFLSELSPAENGVTFWCAAFFGSDAAGRQVTMEVLVTLATGESHKFTIGRLSCGPVPRQPAAAPASAAPVPLVAICLASYEPELTAFRRQVESIRAQSHRNWVCLVNDDGTADGKWREMKSVCGNDERFRFYRNERNLGFYGNFEKALSRVPESADYVALSDQDDFWYPDKLSRLMEALHDSGAVLAYSDMRIVDANGDEVASSYWVNRRNEHEDFPVVLVANTVTGAASLFDAGLLDRVLPFPPRVGDAFHDHWIACNAMTTGRLAYVDAPLYDYYQYGSSVIGHCDFVRFSMWQRLVSLVRFCLRLCRPSVAGPLLRLKYASALAVYRGECRRLRLLCKTISRRGGANARQARQLHLFDGGLSSLIKLLVLHCKVLLKGQTTDDAELRLAMGELARIVERKRLDRRHADR